jgi:hypothetical protein
MVLVSIWYYLPSVSISTNDAPSPSLLKTEPHDKHFYHQSYSVNKRQHLIIYDHSALLTIMFLMNFIVNWSKQIISL